MARQIAYDPAKLKHDVMTLFWEKGYAETSLFDLESATGLNRRQLYNGVGDKRQMFLQAMDDFTGLSGQHLLAPLEHEDAGVAEIKELFQKFIELAKQTTGPKGCMVCSSSQDAISREKDVAVRIDAFFDRVRAAHRNALSRAQERGEIFLGPEALERRADALYGTHVALCILGRAGRETDQLEGIAAQALEGLT